MICPWKENAQIPWDFEIKNGHLIKTKRSHPVLINKNLSCHKFNVPADHKVKVKEMQDKYLDIAGELKMLWNMKVTGIPIIVDGP